MSTYRSFDKNNCMYFMTKEEKVFDKHNEIWENNSKIIKKINSELAYSKKYIKYENKISTKENFHVFICQ